MWSKRSSRVWTNYTITTLAVLLIFILLNFLANRYSIRLDLTENQQLSLSPQSQEIIKNLSNPLKVWVFEYPPDSRDEDLLENYQQYNSNFQFQFVDPQINIPLAQKFNVQYPGAVYLEYNNKQYLVQQLNEVERISEINLTNGIAKIQRDRLFNIYFLQGHGEYPLEGAEGSLSVAISNLANQGYQVQPLNLAQSLIIPGNTNLIIIAGSQRELLAEEAAVLTNYLNNQGGRLLIMVNPNSNLGLDDLLKDWGVELDERLVIDLSTTSSMLNLGPGIPIVTNYGNHPISKDFQEGISLYPLARAVITNTIEGIETVPLLITNEQTWAESDLESEQITFDQETDLKGPLNLGVALKNTESDSRLVVFGNGTFN